MEDLYVWQCERNEDHYVMTAAPTNAAVPGYVCQTCGGRLRPSRRFPRDRRPRAGVNIEAAEKAIEQQGYYASTARVVATEESGRFRGR